MAGLASGSGASDNALAAEVLRSADQRKAELGAIVLSADSAEQARHVVYQHLRPGVAKDGSITCRIADGGRVTDQARQVRVDEVSVTASFLALRLPADRFGDRPLAVDGSDQFKAQLTFPDKRAEAESQRHVREVAARPALAPTLPSSGDGTRPDPEIAQFVARRNEVRGACLRRASASGLDAR